MTLTLNDNWIERSQRDGHEERFLVSITKGSTTWSALTGPCSAFSYPVAVRSVEALTARMDVLTRKLEIDGTTVVVQDTWIRDLMVANRLRGAKMRIRHGFADLAEADFIDYWTGSIEGIFPEPSEEANQGEVRIECLSMLEALRQQKIRGYWVQMHPLDVIYDILANRCNIDSSLIDAAAFDPDAAGYTTISHLVVTRADVARFYTDGAIREPTPAFDIIDELAMLLNGTLYVTEDGELSFRIFDSTASQVDTWDEDVIGELKQVSLHDKVINQIEFKFMPEQLSGSGLYGLYNGAYIVNDTDSQSNHAYPGTTSRVITHKVDSPWVSGGICLVTTVFGSPATGIGASDTTFYLTGGPVPTFCGTRESYPSSPANAMIGTTRPLYLLTDTGEIIKATAFTTTSENIPTYSWTGDEDGDPAMIGPHFYWWAVGTVTRGALGTVAAACNKVVDITTEQYLADQWLTRHGDGIAQIEVTTGLDQFDKEIGDFIGIEWPAYVGYGHDGMTAGAGNWEILQKEHDPDGNRIKWVLAWAGVSTPTRSYQGIQQIYSRTLNAFARTVAEEEHVIQKHIVSGLGVTHGAGLVVTVAAGVAAAGVQSSELLGDTDITLTASKDCYIFFDLESRNLPTIAVTLDATAPTPGDLWILLAVVRTNATAAVSIVTSSAPTKAMHGGKLVGESVSAAQIASSAITSAKLATSAVTNSKIAPGAVVSGHVADGTLGPVHQKLTEKKAGMFANAQFSTAQKGRGIV